jgi:hypothetical protein
MNPLTRECLDRTFLLMRDEVTDDVSDETLFTALHSTDVVLTGNAENLSSHAAQCALVTSALLMARSAHRVYLDVPDLPLAGRQPPLKLGTLVSSLIDVSRDLVPGVEFSVGAPQRAVDLGVVFGDSTPRFVARASFAVNASAWSAYLHPLSRASRWRERRWPFGGLAVSALVAGEAFKISMRKLRRFARVPAMFDKMFAPTREIRFDLAPPEAPRTAGLGNFDFVSGGAIANVVLFCLGRIPDVTGNGRIVEDSVSDHSNLNRYSLLRRSQISARKVNTLLEVDLGELRLTSAPVRLDQQSVGELLPLAQRVLVGVDHIPTRWFVQRLQPTWLGVGATTHWNAMASFHTRELACAGCLHPRDDPADTPIPTAAFVSFWSGLLLAAHFVRSAGGGMFGHREQQVFLTPMRPESVWWSPVARNRECPVYSVRLLAA